MTKYRDRSCYLSSEVLFFARMKKLALCKGDNEASAKLTDDEFIDGVLRNLWTVESPELVVAWSEIEDAKQASKRQYRDIESRCVLHLSGGANADKASGVSK